jgi:hypothetical protein
MSDATAAPTLELSTITPNVRSHGVEPECRDERRLGGSLGIWTGGGIELGVGRTDSVGLTTKAARAFGMGSGGGGAERRAASARLESETSMKGSEAAGSSVVRCSGRITMAGFVGSSSRGSAGGKSRSDSFFEAGGVPAFRLRCLRRSAMPELVMTRHVTLWSHGNYEEKMGLGQNTAA